MTLYSTDLRPSDEKHTAVIYSAPKLPTWYRKNGKRILDLAVVLATCWFTIPIIGFLALAVLVTGQSAFYTQDRIGLGGKTFRIWKLCTMLPNADERLEKYLTNNPEFREEWETKQKLANDPRITPLGRFLRKTSLDELPQLFNVFNGTMSLIGPRPMMLEQKAQYTGNAYYRLRPGMSGLWQVSDRSNGDFVGRVRYDEMYDATLSLSTDVRVIAQTVGVVVRGTGV